MFVRGLVDAQGLVPEGHAATGACVVLGGATRAVVASKP